MRFEFIIPIPTESKPDNEIQGLGRVMEFFQLTAVLLVVCGRGLTFPAWSLEQLGLEDHSMEMNERSRRSADTNAAPLNVAFTVLPLSSAVGECYGGNSTGLGNTTLRLDCWSNVTSQWVKVAAGIPIDAGAYNTTVYAGCVEFRLVQEEHGGGNCNCWTVGGVAVNGSTLAPLSPPPNW